MMSVRSWELWALPRVLQWVLLGQFAVAVTLAPIVVLAAGPVTSRDWLLLGLLATAGSLSERLATRMGEAMTADAADGTGCVVVSTKAVWIFTGLVALPVHMAIALAVFLQVADDVWTRWRRPAEDPHLYYRMAFNSELTLIATLAGATVFSLITGLTEAAGSQLLAGLAAWAVTYGLTQSQLGLVLMLARGRPYSYPGEVIWSVSTEGLGLSSLGFLLALAWSADPLLIIIGVPPVLLLQQALLHQQLREAASTDSKTGLTAATRWREIGEATLSRAQTDRSQLGVLVIDLDHFKGVNDTYGHLVGDDVLVATASAMKACMRKGDVVGRFGGEEFVVLLPETDASQVAAIADRLRLAVGAAEVRVDGREKPLTVTASVGVAAFPHDGYSLNELLEQADRALYAAKHAGRNRVCFPADAAAPDTIALEEIAADLVERGGTEGGSTSRATTAAERSPATQ